MPPSASKYLRAFLGGLSTSPCTFTLQLVGFELFSPSFSFYKSVVLEFFFFDNTFFYLSLDLLAVSFVSKFSSRTSFSVIFFLFFSFLFDIYFNVDMLLD
jgi:hypothetical protein